ncbi:MAG TPA: hypothetical protein VKS21_06525 [Spirochaetota bacterium]|nr:hypothetical protein [Spirochaetota bacterium]
MVNKVCLLGEPDKAVCKLAAAVWQSSATKKGTLRSLYNGLVLLDYLKHWGKFNAQNAPRPALLIINYAIPEMPALEILDEVKHDSELAAIPVVVTMRHVNKKAAAKCRAMGASHVILLPQSTEKMREVLTKLNKLYF